MYARLLARAMDSESAPRAHPAFVEIIKQLTSDEAKILEVIRKEEMIPIVNIKSKYQDDDDKYGFRARYNVRYRLFSPVAIATNCRHPSLFPTYLENLSRSKLVDIREVSIAEEGVYEPIENHPFLDSFRQAINREEAAQIDYDRHIAAITELGKQFCAICVGDSNLTKVI